MDRCPFCGSSGRVVLRVGADLAIESVERHDEEIEPTPTIKEIDARIEAQRAASRQASKLGPENLEEPIKPKIEPTPLEQ